MIAPGSRMRQIGWAMVLTACFVAFAALTLRVNAVKSEVRLAERQIIALQREKLLFETEFQTRANQQQLANWNRIEFGYKAPSADQYLENERQLASLGTPRGMDAPSPIRVAHADSEGGEKAAPAMVSPLTGKPVRQMAANRQPDLSLTDRLGISSAFAVQALGAQVSEAGE